MSAHTPIASTSFAGGSTGRWRIVSNEAVCGERLADAAMLSIHTGAEALPTTSSSAPSAPLVQGESTQWLLRGVVGHARYVHGSEKLALSRVQPPLGREHATRAAFIPIRKSSAWWELAQDERRAILADQSQHIQQGMRFLPAIARRLYQSRELGEPFDFLTWFEFAPADTAAFDELTHLLRRTEEWKFVEREVDIRLELAGR